MRGLSKEQVQAMADILGVPVGQEEIDEVTARFNGMLWTMSEFDNIEWQSVDPVTWIYSPEDV